MGFSSSKVKTHEVGDDFGSRNNLVDGGQHDIYQNIRDTTSDDFQPGTNLSENHNGQDSKYDFSPVPHNKSNTFSNGSKDSSFLPDKWATVKVTQGNNDNRCNTEEDYASQNQCKKSNAFSFGSKISSHPSDNGTNEKVTQDNNDSRFITDEDRESQIHRKRSPGISQPELGKPQEEKEKTKRKKKKKKFNSLHSTANTEHPALDNVDDKSNDLEMQKLLEEKQSMTKQIDAMTDKTAELEMLCRFGETTLMVEDDKECVQPEKFIKSVNFIQKHLLDLKMENNRLRNENNDQLNRLSSVAGSRMTFNNPNIANLNDPNRPGKIAEQYSKIYDDDWTDALQDLQKKLKRTIRDDEVYVYHLYSLIKVIYNTCKDRAEHQIQGLAENMFLMSNPSTQQLDAMWQEYPSQRQKINESRKQTSDIAIQMLRQTITDYPFFHQELRSCKPSLDDSILSVLFTHDYFQKCVEVCWQMVIQDPPMYLETVSLEGTQIDKDSYRLYTNAGFKVKYAVWPALYLHFNGYKGPVMTKGVVQTEKINTDTATEVYTYM